MRLRRSSQSGDTIIEVLFAITIFSLVAVGGLSLMNQGTGMAQRALEVGFVRQQMDAQADILRYLNSAYIETFDSGGVATDVWKRVVTDHREEQAQDFDAVSDNKGCHLPEGNYHPFALNPDKLADVLDPDESANALSTFILAPSTSRTVTYAKVEKTGPDAQGIWIEAVQKTPNSGFYDFHITACWLSPGQATPVKLGTIVRLYEPQK